MDQSTVEYNGKTIIVNIKTITPKQISKLLRVSNIETQALCDEDQNYYFIENDKFNPELKAQKTYCFHNVDANGDEQQPEGEKQYANFQNVTENNTTALEEQFNNQKLNQQKNDAESSEYQKQQEKMYSESPPKTSPKNQSQWSQAIILRDNKAFLESGRIFFANITNGCVAIEELVLLAACTPDVKLSEGRSLRVSVVEAIRILGKSYSEAGNAMNKARLNFGEIPTRIRQCLEIFSDQGDPTLYFQTLQDSVNAGIKAVEENKSLFEAPGFAFIELEQSAKRAQKEEERKNEAERSMQEKMQVEMKRIEKDLQQKHDELKSMGMIIANFGVEIDALKSEAAKKKSGFLGFGGNNTENLNNEIQLLQEQQHSARKRKNQLEDEIDALEVKKLDFKHKVINAKMEPSIDWQSFMKSLKGIISQIEEIGKTWTSVAAFIKTIEKEMNDLRFIASKGNVDNSSLLNAALRLSLNSWVILQCCGIYDDVVKSDIIPLISGVSSNFGLRIEEAKSRLSSEKTKAKNVKDEVANSTKKRLMVAAENLTSTAKETEKCFINILSTVV